MEVNESYMRRALQLARNGLGDVSPNPMVGAVIVAPDGRIIGEGWHRRFGQAHAEVNAVRSVADRAMLRDTTMYVTLEPCSHYGKTPPCARLLIDCGIPRVVVGAVDPNEKVAGRGIAMLREAGVEVVTGVLAAQSRSLNAAFITAHTGRRPFVSLKWARSADGWLDRRRTSAAQPAAAISDASGRMAVHRLRAMHDGILVGSGTVLADNPLLDARMWGGRAPRPVVLDRRGRIDAAATRFAGRDPIVVRDYDGVPSLLSMLYRDHGMTSLLVEGGAEVLNSFVDAGCWDVARVEVSPDLFGHDGAAAAPSIADVPVTAYRIGGNRVIVYARNPLVGRCLIEDNVF